MSAIAVLGLASFLSYRVVSRWAAVLTAALVTVVPSLNRYAAELKHYSPEAAVALAILGAAGWLATRGHIVEVHDFGTAGSALIDLTGTPDAARPRPAADPGFACLTIWPVG